MLDPDQLVYSLSAQGDLRQLGCVKGTDTTVHALALGEGSVWVSIFRDNKATILRYARPQALRLIPSTRPLCMSVGLIKPEIAISEGLLSSLDATEIGVLLAHEGAHVTRRDAAWQLAAEVLSVLHTPSTRDRLLSELSLAAEEVCDQAAAHAVGDRLAVADTIVRVAKLYRGMGPVPGVAFFGATAIERRVEALLAAERTTSAKNAWLTTCAFLLVFLAILATSGSLHHAVESLLSVIHV